MDTPPPPPPPAAQAQIQTAALRVTVLDEEGQPIPGVSVRVEGPTLPVARETQTDAEGVATLAGFDPGQFSVLLERDGFDTVRRRDLVLQAGRIVVLRVELPLSEMVPLDDMLEYPLLPGEGRRGATVERPLLDLLPWVSLGGAAGVLAHPALGTGEAVPARVLGLVLPDVAVGAVPRGLVGELSARSVGLLAPEGGEIGLEETWRPDLQGELTLAGSLAGDPGVEATISGPIQRRWARGMGAVEAGRLGEAAGWTVHAWPQHGQDLWGLAFASPDAWLIGARGDLWRNNRPYGGALSTLVAGTEAGTTARVALDAGLRPWSADTLRLSSRLEGVADGGRLAGLVSAEASGSLWLLDLRSGARVRVGADDQPRLEASVGANCFGGDLESYVHLGQRYEDLDTVSAPPIRSREALVGVAARLFRVRVLASALGAQRSDGATGDPLPGRADLQLAVRKEQGNFEGMASYTFRPALDGANADLPDQEAGLLFGLPLTYRWVLSPTLGLGLQAAWQDGALSGTGAARLGLAYRRDHWRGLLAVEGRLDPDALRQIQIALTVEPGT